jgi:hypothetical protein
MSIQEVHDVIKMTSAVMDKMITLMEELGELKLSIDERMDVISGELPAPDPTNIQIIRLIMAYKELCRQYREMMEQGAALGEELGTKGHYVILQ